MNHARSFGQAADEYERYRPTYARDSVTWALGEAPLRVADLGAGTGIMSRLLRQLGHEVTAIEPDEQMLARLPEASPGVAAVLGAAEAIPLADGSVDAVVAGQAYHWFDPDRALPEIARVLRPGGVFAAFWNDADSGTQWTVKLVEIIDGPALAYAPRLVSDFGPLFDQVEEGTFRHELPSTAARLLASTATRSPYLVADEAGRQAMLDAVSRLITDTGLGETFTMPMLTRVHRARRR
jgi:SAM-dependent methyltransferase